MGQALGVVYVGIVGALGASALAAALAGEPYVGSVLGSVGSILLLWGYGCYATEMRRVGWKPEDRYSLTVSWSRYIIGMIAVMFLWLLLAAEWLGALLVVPVAVICLLRSATVIQREQEQLRLLLHKRRQVAAPGPGEKEPESPEEAEELAARWMVYLGYTDATCTGRGPDGGVDVVSGDAIAQVKHWRKPVPLEVIQRTSGIAHAEGKQSVIFSTGGYTLQAEQWATRCQVPLFIIGGEDGIRPGNEVGRLLLNAAEAEVLGG